MCNLIFFFLKKVIHGLSLAFQSYLQFARLLGTAVGSLLLCAAPVSLPLKHCVAAHPEEGLPLPHRIGFFFLCPHNPERPRRDTRTGTPLSGVPERLL